MIKGQFVDRRRPVVTGHALRRFCERFWTCDREGVAVTFSRSRPLYSQAWWLDGVASYWINEWHDIVFVATCEESALVIVSVLTVEMTLQNPKAASELRAWLRSKSSL